MLNPHDPADFGDGEVLELDSFGSPARDARLAPPRSSGRPAMSEVDSPHAGLVPYGSRGLRLVRGRGAEVTDVDGRSYLDCTSMYGVLPLGHAHPAMLRTLREQSERLANAFLSFGTPEREALIAELGDAVAPALGLGPNAQGTGRAAADASPAPGVRFFFCNSGAEAIEAAAKLARATTGRPGFVAASGGFHGRTLGATSLTHRPQYRKPYEPLVPGVTHVRYGDLDALREVVGLETAAVFLEPVQGEGGVNPAPDGYLRAAGELCRERGALLVLDEIQTGFGRCGALWAGADQGAVADLVCLAKGIANGFPMGAVAAGPQVEDFPAGTHGSTFGGGPLACALARTCLRVLQEEELPGAVAAAAPAWQADLAATSSERIREVRGRGYLIGIELREEAAPIQAAMQERGVLTLTAGRQVLRLLPPLVLGAAQRDRVTETLAEVLA